MDVNQLFPWFSTHSDREDREGSLIAEWRAKTFKNNFERRRLYKIIFIKMKDYIVKTMSYLRAEWNSGINHSPFLEHSEEYVGVSAVFAIFCHRIWHRFMSRLGEEYEFVECFRRKLKLSTYLYTVGFNHISFLNTRSQLVWVLASSRFYSITWRMTNSKIYFRKQSPLRGNFFPFRFLWIYASFLEIRPRLPCFHTIK